MQTVDVLGVRFHAPEFDEAVAAACAFLEGDKAHTVYTANPEFVMRAREDAEFMEVLNRGDMVIPDGIGAVYAMRINGVKVKDRVPGYDLAQALFLHLAQTGKTVYFLGGTEASVTKAKTNMEAKYPGLRIVGCHDGYFDAKKEITILEDIREKRPDLLLAGLGFPRQEKWIDAHKDLPVRLMIGVGGSFDVMSGTVKRAPVFFQKIGMEWFYRLLCQPSRLRRQMILPLFMMTVIGVKLFGKKGK